MYEIDEIINKCIAPIEQIIDIFGCDKEHIINMSNYINFNLQGIYFLIQDNEIVYIGQTVNLFSRMTNHHIFKDGVYKITFLQVKDISDLDIIECFYIRKFRPRLNKDKKGILHGRSGRCSIEKSIAKKLSDKIANTLMIEE